MAWRSGRRLWQFYFFSPFPARRPHPHTATHLDGLDELFKATPPPPLPTDRIVAFVCISLNEFTPVPYARRPELTCCSCGVIWLASAQTFAHLPGAVCASRAPESTCSAVSATPIGGTLVWLLGSDAHVIEVGQVGLLARHSLPKPVGPFRCESQE